MPETVPAASTVGPPVGLRVRLSSNESPFGPSPRAVEAATAALGEGHRYPDDQAVALREALAAHEGVGIEEISVGTGSAGLLMDTVAHACQDAGGLQTTVVAFERAFVVFRLAAANAGATYLEAPTDGPATGEGDGYGRSVDALLDLVDDHTRVVMVDNPGNPTGAHLTGAELRALLEGVPEHVTVVVDEAYHHFAAGQRGYASVGELGLDHPRLLVTRTFSKAHALAGLRVGYAVGPADLVARLDAWRVRFNVTATAQAAALASLGDRDHVDACVQSTVAGRARMAAALRERGVPFTDGLGNFLTVEVGRPAAAVVDDFAAHGVGVRALAPYGMDEQIRVTVGTPDEVDAFLTAAADVLPTA